MRNHFFSHIVCVFLILYFIKIMTYEPFKNIEYPNADEATKVLTDDVYFNHFNDNDFFIRGITKDNYKKIYKTSIIPITDNTKNIINGLINQINLFGNTTWKIIQTHNIESTMPHTQKDSIIFSNLFIENIKNGKNLRENQRVLVHEQTHVLQRIYKDDFERLYNEWGFKYIDNIKNFDINNNRTNPDGLELNWVFEYNGVRILPIALYKRNATNLRNVEYYGLDISEDNYIIGKSLLKDNKYYSNYFGIEYNYHPNEISAVYFEYYFIEKITNKPQLPGIKGYNIFKQWLESVNFV